MSYIQCPMPDCERDLYIAWSLMAGLYLDNEAPDELPAPDGAWTGGWQIECEEGHVILTPGKPGCDCDDEGGETCPHINERDWTDELRTFRAHDVERLKALIDRMKPLKDEAVPRG